MIISERTVGYSSVRGSPFSNRKGFSSRRPVNSATMAYSFDDLNPTSSLVDNNSIFRLQNSKTDFLFRADDITGVRIDKFKSINSSSYFINKSRILWELCIIRNSLADTPLISYYDSYFIRPSKATFISPSVDPIVLPDGSKSFNFVWDGVKYDYSNSSRTLKVTLTVILKPLAEYVEMSLKVESNQPFARNSLSICVSAVGMPGLSIRKSGNSNLEESDFFSAPVMEGQTILNPIKRLQAPRFENESIQYNDSGTKSYFGTSLFGYSPFSNGLRGSFGHPGNLTIPIVLFGNRETKDGFLYYAFDSEGIHAKNFQFYSNGSTLNLKSYDISDNEVEPFGVGGKDTRKTLYNMLSLTDGGAASETKPIPQNQFGNTLNQIGWTIRIQPYKSPTRWADWYGATLYKDTVVSDLESYGVVPKSFYNRYLDGKITSLKDIEIPICSLSFGHLSGDASQLFSGVHTLQNYVTTITNKDTPKAINFYFERSLNANPISSSFSGLEATYHGWEPWADGTNSSSSLFNPPDMTGLNSVYSGAVGKSFNSGQYSYNYLAFPFAMSTGSSFVLTHSGIDLSIKSFYNKDHLTTSQDYSYYLTNSFAGVTGNSFHICPSSPQGYHKYKELISGMASFGSFVYDDTFGNWGRGCYASSHQFYDIESGVTRTYSHPKGRFNYFFNKLQKDWITGAVAQENLPSSWAGPTGDGFSLGHGTEYICDANLNHSAFSMLYSPVSLISNHYYTPLSLTNPLYTGSMRTDILFGSLDQILWNSASVEAKNWNQLNPIYSTVYGDRSILLDLTSYWVSNFMDVSGFFGKKPGTETLYGYPNTVNLTHEERQLHIKNWMAGHLNHFTRMTAGVVSLQYSGINTGYTNHIDNTIMETLNKDYWTGIRSYTSNILRLLSYAPDYMYHGTIENPLDSWDATNSYEAYIPRGIRTSRIPNSANWDRGDDTVVHGLKRHRSTEGILLWLANWFSGDQGFTGVFDPRIYEFNKGYTAYSLGLGDSDYGVITDLGKYSKYDSFIISGQVPQNSLVAYLFEPLDGGGGGSGGGGGGSGGGGTTSSEEFLGLTTDFVYLRYAYGQEVLSSTSASIIYDYGCDVVSDINNPIVGVNAPATQEILNNLPPWMAARQNTGSITWGLVNSWGQNLENLVEQTSDFIANKFLTTSNVTKRSLLYYSDVTEKELLQPRLLDNMLFNSSFSIPSPSRYSMPAGYSNYDKERAIVSLTYDKPYICPGSISINRTGKFGQTITANNRNIKDITSSVYVLADTPNVEITLITIAETIDGYSLSNQSTITSRSTEWRRITHTLPINAKVYRIQFIVTCSCDGVIYFNAPAVTESSMVNPWSRSVVDSLPFVQGSNPFQQTLVIGNNISTSRKINLFPINKESDFLEIAIPTRIEKVSPYLRTELESFTNNIFGRKVSFYKEVYDTQWVIQDNQIQLRSYSGSEFDIFRTFSIRDLQYSEDLSYGTYEEDNYSYEILLLTVREGYLYVLCRESYYGRESYVIKVISAQDPYGSHGYLESIIDFKIDLPVNENNYFDEIQELPSTIAFSDVDSSLLVITTNLSRQFYYRLYFDYQYFSPANNRVYTIEDYLGLKVSIT